VSEERIVNDDAFSSFYSAEYSYRVTRSKYGDRVASTTTRQVKEARNLTATIDTVKKSALTADLTRLRTEQRDQEAKVDALNAEEKELRKQDDPIRHQRVYPHSSFFVWISTDVSFDALDVAAKYSEENQ